MIDDLNGTTVAAAGSLAKGGKTGGNVKSAAAVGQRLAEAAKAAGVSKAAFDRGHFKYHGRLKALAEAVRAGGIQF
jgi:large subunit ribosomal protein L18